MYSLTSVGHSPHCKLPLNLFLSDAMYLITKMGYLVGGGFPFLPQSVAVVCKERIQRLV